jgi:hypothetical protein
MLVEGDDGLSTEFNDQSVDTHSVMASIKNEAEESGLREVMLKELVGTNDRINTSNSVRSIGRSDHQVDRKFDLTSVDEHGIKAMAEKVLVSIGIISPNGIRVGIHTIALAKSIAFAAAAQRPTITRSMRRKNGAVAAHMNLREITKQVAIGGGNNSTEHENLFNTRK